MGWSSMPEGCISHILSLTSPRDTCALSAVSSISRSAADSDIVWERFLPPDYEDILSRAVAPIEFLSMKDLYFRLCHPILIDGGRKGFVLEKSTGNKCFMLSARELSITWGDTPQYWTWISLPDSRFQEVAGLVKVCWLDITGRLRTRELSPDTIYVAYLIFKLTKDSYGFDCPEQKASVITRDQHSTKTAYLKRRAPNEETNHFPYVRADGWFEVVMGEFFNEAAGNEEEVVVRLFEIERLGWKRGLVVEGIEFRPKK